MAIWDNAKGTLTRWSKFLNNDLLQLLVNLATHLYCFRERGGANRSDHRLLKSRLIARMHTSIQDIEERHWHHEWLFCSRFTSKKLIQRNILNIYQPIGFVSIVSLNSDLLNGPHPL